MSRNRIVKVRVTEAEYCDWVQMALEASVSLSEAIRRAMCPRSYPDGEAFLESLTEPRQLQTTKLQLPPGLRGIYGTGATNIPQRRSVSCPHSKPPYAFCPECDGK